MEKKTKPLWLETVQGQAGWGPCSSGRCPCPLQDGVGWSFKFLSNQAILSFQLFFHVVGTQKMLWFSSLSLFRVNTRHRFPLKYIKVGKSSLCIILKDYKTLVLCLEYRTASRKVCLWENSNIFELFSNDSSYFPDWHLVLLILSSAMLCERSWHPSFAVT